MQIISKSYETADRFQTHPNALSTHTWPHIHFFQTFKSLYSQRTLPASDVKTRDLSLKTFCTNLGLPSSLPHTTTVRKYSVYQKKSLQIIEGFKYKWTFYSCYPYNKSQAFQPIFRKCW